MWLFIIFLLLTGDIDSTLKEGDWICWARPIERKTHSSLAWDKKRDRAEIQALKKCIKHFKRKCILDSCVRYHR